MPKKPIISPTLYMTDTLETTLCIIKPDAMASRKEILRRIIRKGFQILIRKRFQLSPEQAADFYQEYESLRTYMLMVLNLSNGPLEVAILTKEDAIDQFIGLMGPEKPSIARCMCPGSLRAIYGNCVDDLKNAIHGSLDPEAARREIHFFFPNFIVEPLSRDSAKRICCKVNFIDPFMTGLQQLSKNRPTEPLIWTSKWLLSNNPDRPAITEVTLDECQLKQKQAAEVKLPCPESSKRDRLSGKSEYTSTSTSSSSAGTSSPLCSSSSAIICSCSSTRTQSSSAENLAKVLCCCNIEVKPGEIVVCPVCEKIVQYTVPVKVTSSENDSTTTTSCTLVSDEKRSSTHTKPGSPPCGAKRICETCIPQSSSGSSPASTQTSSTHSKNSFNDLLHEVIEDCINPTTSAE